MTDTTPSRGDTEADDRKRGEEFLRLLDEVCADWTNDPPIPRMNNVIPFPSKRVSK